MLMTNKQFAKTDEKFMRDCGKARVLPTARQASKYLQGKGIARKVAIRRCKPLENGMPGFDPIEKVSL